MKLKDVLSIIGILTITVILAMVIPVDATVPNYCSSQSTITTSAGTFNYHATHPTNTYNNVQIKVTDSPVTVTKIAFTSYITLQGVTQGNVQYQFGLSGYQQANHVEEPPFFAIGSIDTKMVYNPVNHTWYHPYSYYMGQINSTYFAWYNATAYMVGFEFNLPSIVIPTNNTYYFHCYLARMNNSQPLTLYYTGANVLYDDVNCTLDLRLTTNQGGSGSGGTNIAIPFQWYLILGSGSITMLMPLFMAYTYKKNGMSLHLLYAGLAFIIMFFVTIAILQF